MNSDINEDINLNPSVVIKKIKFNDNTEIELSNDDIVVFVIAMATTKVVTASTKYNKYSHLVSGILMFVIGVLLIFKPEWLMFNF